MRALFIQSFIELILHDLFLVQHDFAALHSKVHFLPVSCRVPAAGDTAEICEAVAHASIWYPKRVPCLQRSIVAVSMLRRYGIQAEMVIGAQILPLKAHAWAEVDGCVVNDRPEVQSDYLVMERC